MLEVNDAANRGRVLGTSASRASWRGARRQSCCGADLTQFVKGDAGLELARSGHCRSRYTARFIEGVEVSPVATRIRIGMQGRLRSIAT